MREIHSQSELSSLLESGDALHGTRLQGLDLRPHKHHLLARTDVRGTIVLGGRLGKGLERHLRRHGALVFPTDPQAPIDPYRARLYHPRELYAGIEVGGYPATPDARAFVWAHDARLAGDTFVTMTRAIHDDSVSDALDELLDGFPAVGVMGGHNLARGTQGYAAAADLGHRLADGGVTVLTGGGPGAMEAANLGAFALDRADLEPALDLVSSVPGYADDVTAWVTVALRARGLLSDTEERPRQPRSVGIPTWFYGHEPPNVFCDAIAKYFSNALREDVLLNRANAGIVVLPGAAGTVQEIFQAATPMYYADPARPGSALVLVGVEHWSSTVPLWPVLTALAEGRPMSERIHLVETVDEAAAIILGSVLRDG